MDPGEFGDGIIAGIVSLWSLEGQGLQRPEVSVANDSDTGRQNEHGTSPVLAQVLKLFRIYFKTYFNSVI
jgi:hypothetical protein